MQDPLAVWQDVHRDLQPARLVHLTHVKVRVLDRFVDDQPVKRRE